MRKQATMPHRNPGHQQPAPGPGLCSTACQQHIYICLTHYVRQRTYGSHVAVLHRGSRSSSAYVTYVCDTHSGSVTVTVCEPPDAARMLTTPLKVWPEAAVALYAYLP